MTLLPLRIHEWSRRLPLLWISLVLIVFGARMMVYNHYAVDSPFSDDWEIASDIQAYKEGAPLSSLIFKTHVQHIIAFTRIEQLLTVELNGIWQLRAENLFHGLALTVYALVTTLAIRRAVPGASCAVYAAAVVAFAIPWAGDRTLWSLTSSFCWMMLWSVTEVALLSFVAGRNARLALSLVVCSLSSVSMGAGSLTALVACCWFGWEIIRGERSARIHNAIAILLHVGLFLFFYSLVPGSGSGMVSDLPTTIKAFFRCLAFPLINVWPAGLVIFAPWFFLAARVLSRKELPNAGETFLFLLGSIVILQSAGIAVFRGENNNGGIPSSRYYDILILGPLLNFAILLRHGMSRGGRPSVAFPAWVSFASAGYLLIFFWRVVPWLSLDSGEWEQGLKQSVIASWVRGDLASIPAYEDIQAPEVSYHKEADSVIRRYVSLANDPSSFLPGAMFAGYALQNTTPDGGFSLGGYPGNRKPRPWLRYWGSYDRTAQPDKPRQFESAPFVLSHPYVQFEFILDKKSRFRFYNLGNSSLKLVNTETNVEVDVLRRLRGTLPSILNDREIAIVKLPEPGSYKVMATDGEIGSGWFSFSEPTPCGNLAAFTQPVLNSGKIFLSAGIMALVVWLCIGKNRGGRPEAEPAARAA